MLWARYDPMDKAAGLASDLVDGEAAPSILDEQVILLRKQEQEAQIRRDRLQLSSEIGTKQTLLSKLKSMTGENPSRQATIDRIEQEVGEIQKKLDTLPPVEELPVVVNGDQSIQDQLAQAEKEAAAFGLVDELGNIVYGKIGRGGGGRGRGRGRGGRGRGRESTRRPPMTLDNRPKTLAVRGIPENFLNEKMIRSHFQSFGDLGRVGLGVLGEKNSALVEFKTRNMAEQALSQGQMMLKNSLQLDWYDGQMSVMPTAVLESSVVPADPISDDDDDEDVDRSWKR